MPPKKKHEQSRDGDVVLAEFGEISIMRSAGGGEYLTAPGELSIDIDDFRVVERAGRASPAQRVNLTKAVARAKERWGR